MYTSKRTLMAGAWMLVLTAAPASAQMLAWQDTVYVSVNGGLQAGSDEFQQAFAFGLYGEAATVRVPHTVDSGGLLDIAGGARLTGNVGVGVAFSRFARSEDVPVEARLPHPVFANALRPASSAIGGIKHRQNAVHLHALYMVPLSDRIDIAFFGGPSILSVSHQVATGISIQDQFGPPFTPTITSTAIRESSDTTVGINLGADWSYIITDPQTTGGMPVIGAGVFLRFVSGSADLPEVPDIGTQDLGVGGFQLGVGARLRWR